jgi:tetraprenyl-beta-curcumene synthase
MQTIQQALSKAKESAALAAILVRYWTLVFPLARRELARWRELAAAIPDPRLRAVACGTLDEEGGLAEGAAIFATLVPGWHVRRELVTLLVAWQVLYDCLDTLGEQLVSRSPEDAAELYAVLAGALDGAAGDAGDADDGSREREREYVSRLIACCRVAVAELPSIEQVRPFAVRAAQRCADAQALTHAVVRGGGAPLRRWASEQPRTEGFLWWEVAAGAISSLGVHALLATAALPRAGAAEAARVDAAYFPSICALSTLLDSTIDEADDAGTANHRPTTYYGSTERTTERLEAITRVAAAAARGLPNGRGHVVILAGMTAYYAAAGWDGHEGAHRRVAAAVGVAVSPIVWTLRVRAGLTRRPPSPAIGGIESETTGAPRGTGQTRPSKRTHPLADGGFGRRRLLQGRRRAGRPRS